jgi:hypothetical protein
MEGISTTLRRCLLAGAALFALCIPATMLVPQAASAASTPKTALLNTDSVTFEDGLEIEETH